MSSISTRPVETSGRRVPEVAGEVYETRSGRREVRVICPHCGESHWHDVTDRPPEVLLRCPVLGEAYRVAQPTYGPWPGSA